MSGEDGWRRLHPLTPLLVAGRIVLAVLVAGLQLGGELVGLVADPTGSLAVAGALVVLALSALAYSAVAWRFRRYRIGADRVEATSGVVVRSARDLPFDRIESVDTAQPLLPRLLGLAEVRVEAISSKGDEVRLRYLSLADAERLRREIDARRRVATHEAGDDDGDGEPPVVALLQVPARELVLGYGLLPAATAAALVLPPAVAGGLVLAGPGGGALGAVLGALGGLVLPLGAAIARIERLWDFRVEDAGDALVLRRGLLNLSTQRIATGRVQALRIDQPPLWRAAGRARVVVDVAGHRGAKGDAAAAAATLLPVAPEAVVRDLIARLEVRTDLVGLRFEPAPAAARLRSPRWRSFGLALTPTHAVVRSGVLWRRTAIVPVQRLQSARVTQGPWQRALGLATLHLDTAGARVRARALHRTAVEAVAVAARATPDLEGPGATPPGGGAG